MIKFLYGVSACALSAVFIVNFANAQESREASQAATSAEEQGVNDIIVTAQKRSENMALLQKS